MEQNAKAEPAQYVEEFRATVEHGFSLQNFVDRITFVRNHFHLRKILDGNLKNTIRYEMSTTLSNIDELIEWLKLVKEVAALVDIKPVLGSDYEENTLLAEFYVTREYTEEEKALAARQLEALGPEPEVTWRPINPFTCPPNCT